MSYAILADTIDRQRTVLARHIAKEGKTAGLDSYHALTTDALAQQIEITLTMVTTYIRSGNTDAHTAYIQQLVRNLYENGRDTDDALTITEIMIVQLQQMIAREWPGDANQATRARYIQMIRNVHNFGQITFKAARLVVRREQREAQQE